MFHLYWKKVISTLNQVFQAHIPEDPKQCLLGILDNLAVEDSPRQAIARALFPTRKQIEALKVYRPSHSTGMDHPNGGEARHDLKSFYLPAQRLYREIRCSGSSSSESYFGPHIVTTVKLLFIFCTGHTGFRFKSFFRLGFGIVPAFFS